MFITRRVHGKFYGLDLIGNGEKPGSTRGLVGESMLEFYSDLTTQSINTLALDVIQVLIIILSI